MRGRFEGVLGILPHSTGGARETELNRTLIKTKWRAYCRNKLASRQRELNAQEEFAVTLSLSHSLSSSLTHFLCLSLSGRYK